MRETEEEFPRVRRTGNKPISVAMREPKITEVMQQKSIRNLIKGLAEVKIN
jgi:hypothetical protein